MRKQDADPLAIRQLAVKARRQVNAAALEAVFDAVSDLSNGGSTPVKLGDIAMRLEIVMRLRAGAGYRLAQNATQRLKLVKRLEYVGGVGAGWLPKADKAKKEKR